MEKIYIVGDMHTVSALRLCGVQGVVPDVNAVRQSLDDIIDRGDAGIIAITNQMAEGIEDVIAEMNLTMDRPIIIAIPGIDDKEGFRSSVVAYIAEALGMAL